MLFVISLKWCNHKSEENQSLIKQQKLGTKRFDFGWLRTIYYEKTLEKSETINSQPEYKIIKMRVFLTFLLAVIQFLQVWFTIESVYYAVSVDVNLGVIESFSAIQPFISGIIFYLAFHKPLNICDMLGILVIMISIALFALSSDTQESNNGKFNPFKLIKI